MTARRPATVTRPRWVAWLLLHGLQALLRDLGFRIVRRRLYPAMDRLLLSPYQREHLHAVQQWDDGERHA